MTRAQRRAFDRRNKARIRFLVRVVYGITNDAIAKDVERGHYGSRCPCSCYVCSSGGRKRERKVDWLKREVECA